MLKLLNDNYILCLSCVHIKAFQMFFYKENLNDNVNITCKHEHVSEF